MTLKQLHEYFVQHWGEIVKQIEHATLIIAEKDKLTVLFQNPFYIIETLSLYIITLVCSNRLSVGEEAANSYLLLSEEWLQKYFYPFQYVYFYKP
jgi:hypothetical protein